MNDNAEMNSDASAPEVEVHPDAQAPETKPVRRRRSTKAADAQAEVSSGEAGGGGQALTTETNAVQVAEAAASPKPQVRKSRSKAVAAPEPDRAQEIAPSDEVDAAPERALQATADVRLASEGPSAEGPHEAAAPVETAQAEGPSARVREGRGGASAAEEEAEHSTAPQPAPDASERFAQVLSGEFDAQVEALAQAPEAPVEADKRVLLPEPEAPKLHKVLAQSGIGSRRDMERLIEEGLVEVNGEVAHTGQRVSFGDQVKVKGKPVRIRILPGTPRILAYHKPVGEVVTLDDPQQRPTVFRNLPRLQQGKWQSVGRLDINTEGLLLFTNSGELANQLMHPRFGVEREYAVRVLGTLDAAARERLLTGVEIDGQSAHFKAIENGGGEGVNHWYRVVITEGRNREVRKLFDAVGLAVSRLIRIRYGTVVLPRGLKRGVWIDLPEADVRTIRRLASPQRPAQGGRDDRREGRADGRPEGRGDGRGDGRSDGRRGRDRDRQGKPRADAPQARQAEGQTKGPDRARRDKQGPKPQRGRPSEGQGVASERRFGPDDEDIDFDPARIPNPLEQTFDKRFVKNPRTPAGGRGFRNGGGGFGPGGSAATSDSSARAQKKGGPREPDPLQTSVGYIGADAYLARGGRGGRGGGGGRRGGR
jgi:23S rRNA pseudouridine2605 synthase